MQKDRTHSSATELPTSPTGTSLQSQSGNRSRAQSTDSRAISNSSDNHSRKNSRHESVNNTRMHLDTEMPERPSVEECGSPSRISNASPSHKIVLPKELEEFAEIDTKKKQTIIGRIQDSKPFRILILGTRFFDWLSDIILMVTLMWVLIFSPSVTIDIVPEQGSLFSRIILNYTSGTDSRYCGFRRHLNIPNTCKIGNSSSSSQIYRDTVYQNEFLGNQYFSDDVWENAIFQYLSSQAPRSVSLQCLNVSDYGTVIAGEEHFNISYGLLINNTCVNSTSATVGLTFLRANNADLKSKLCSKNVVRRNEFEFNLVSSCASASTLVPSSVINQDTFWDCSTIIKGSRYTCMLSDTLLINMLIVFLFVMIAKEILMLANYQFIVFHLEMEQLNMIAADSFVIILIYCIRIFGCRLNLKKAHMSIQSNQVFFFTWFIFDFSQKVASGTLSFLVLLTLQSYLAGLSLLGTGLGFLTSLRFWYQSMAVYFIKNHFERVSHEAGHDDDFAKIDEDDDIEVSVGVYGCSIYDLPESVFPPTTFWTSVRVFFLRILNFCWEILRFGMSGLAILSWSVIASQKFIQNDNSAYLKLKIMGAVLIAAVLGELSRFWERLVIAREKMATDAAVTFTDATARKLINAHSAKFLALFDLIETKLSWRFKFAMNFIETPHVWEILIIIPLQAISAILISTYFLALQQCCQIYDVFDQNFSELQSLNKASTMVSSTFFFKGQCLQSFCSQQLMSDIYLINAARVVLYFHSAFSLLIIVIKLLNYFSYNPLTRNIIQYCTCIDGKNLRYGVATEVKRILRELAPRKSQTGLSVASIIED